MHVLEATASKPGPDGNAEQTRVETVRLELRDAQPSGRPYRHLEGRAVPYDTWENVGWFLEQHVAGSFERSTKGLGGKNAPLLLFHDNRSWPVGHAESWTHDSDGMWGVWRLDGGEPAQRAAQMAADGHLTGLSVGFQPIRSKWELVDDWDPDADEDHMDRVSRIESRLVEVSITPTPAFQDAQITLVRHQARYSREARRAARGETEKDRWLAIRDRLRSGV
jgi:HK97 family phage prohead protease